MSSSNSNRTRKPGLCNLKIEILRETIEDLAKLGMNDRGVQVLALSRVIIINALGPEFWAKETTSFGDRQPIFEDEIGEVRLSSLASNIWDVRTAEGLKKFIQDKPLGHDMKATCFEFKVGAMVSRAATTLSFVERSGVKGDDFDLNAKGFQIFGDVNIEVKSRTQEFDTGKNLTNFLGDCRKQMPPGGNGVLFIQLVLSARSIRQHEIIETSKRFLKGTERVSCIIFVWEEEIENEIGRRGLGYKYFSVEIDGIAPPVFEPYPNGESSFVHDLGFL